MSEVKKAPRSRRMGLLFSSSSIQNHNRAHLRQADQATTSHGPQSPRKPTVSTRILILSDTHGHASLPSPLPDLNLDVIIHSGDLSQCGSISDYQATLTLLSSLPAPLKLVIPGNHDLSLDPLFPSANKNFTDAERQELHTQALAFWTGPEAREEGVAFLHPGFHEFVLRNGGRLKVYATPYTPFPTGVDVSEWAFGHASSDDLYNPPGTGIWYSVSKWREEMLIEDERRGEVDVLVSHGPPRYRLDRTEPGENVGCKHLWRAVRRCRPRVHVFGHVHAGFGAERVVWKEERELPRDDDVDDGIARVERNRGERGEGVVRFVAVGKQEGQETLFVNAALMGEERLVNMPWIVEMELERVLFTAP